MPTNPTSRFPRSFTWGVATASAQIEGSAEAHGKGPSIWDTWSPGHVLDGDTPAVACDHYRRWKGDLDLMRKMGVRHYRFSVAWPRVMPVGTGAVNERGLDFYDRLVDGMLARGIEPWCTLFHWDLPQALEDRGGWTVRSTAEAFRPYADAVVRRLGDRVKNWFTHNELACFIGHGYGYGCKAPGRREPAQIVNQAYHHALLAHGHGVAAVREHGGRGARVGLVTNGLPFIPATGSDADVRAAARLFAQENDPHHAPVFLGRYPAALMRSPVAPQVARGDLALIAQKTDFFGLNCYLASYARSVRGVASRLDFTADHPRAQPSWLALTHDALYWGVRQFTERYGISSLFITENGAAFVDPAPGADGTIADLHRLDYLRGHVRSAHRAVSEGLPLHGYFAWSFMDNFEWARGYAERFGLVHVDFATQRRTPKLSGRWYAELMRRNAIV